MQVNSINQQPNFGNKTFTQKMITAKSVKFVEQGADGINRIIGDGKNYLIPLDKYQPRVYVGASLKGLEQYGLNNIVLMSKPELKAPTVLIECKNGESFRTREQIADYINAKSDNGRYKAFEIKQ